jgi:hypothetical protein
MTLFDAAALLLLGLAAGWVGGLLGIAGSILMIPGMGLLFGDDQFHLHQAAAMLVNVFVVAPAVWQHARARAIDPGVVRWTIPAAVAGALGGVFLGNRRLFRGPGQGWLQLLFEALLAYEVFEHGRRLWNGRRAADLDDPRAANRPHSALRLIGLVGLPTGGLGGLLGVGGGLIAVPAQQAFLRIPLRQAIANSAATIVCSSAIAAASKNASLGVHHLSFASAATLAAFLIPGALVGSWYGGGHVHRWPIRTLRFALVILLSAAAFQLTWSGWTNVHAHGAL